MLLAGDIGGTKTNLALFSVERGPRDPLTEATFPSREYANLGDLVREFLSEVDHPVESASFGVAGPVVDRQVEVTNLPWVIDAKTLEEQLDIHPVRLLNDLEAIAHAVPFLESDDVYTLNKGKQVREGNKAVIAPGTGLGEAFLTWDGSRYRAYPSEGGHVDFGPTTPLQMDMLHYLQEKFDRVSYERVCSGIGIPHIYEFLKESGHAKEPEWLSKKLAEVDDPTPVIAKAALAEGRTCDLCQVTMDTFVSVLGAEAGNLALKVLATGGVYLGGGIPPRILPLLKGGQFLASFTDKGRFSDLLSQVPVHVILNPKVALLGAACHGLVWLHDIS
ncbi:MAG: glucokinase [Anaerolineales bacterium]